MTIRIRYEKTVVCLYSYLAFESAGLSVEILRARIVAMDAFPSGRAGTSAVDRITFGSVQTRTTIATIRSPFMLRASYLFKQFE